MSQIKSKERVVQRDEVFTSEREVNAMLALVDKKCLRPDSRFLEPACGPGNILAAILKLRFMGNCNNFVMFSMPHTCGTECDDLSEYFSFRRV